MDRYGQGLRAVGMGLSTLALLYAGAVSAATCFVYHNWALLSAIVAAFVGGHIWGLHASDKAFYEMRDQAEQSLQVADAAIRRCEMLDHPPFACDPDPED